MTAADLIAGARELIKPLTGHTEGEWCADLSETYSVRERDGARIASCSHLNKLGRRSNDEAAANCRLSAASPVMRDTIEAQADHIDAQARRIEALEAALAACADDLEGWIHDGYDGVWSEAQIQSLVAPFRAALQADEVAQ